MTTEHIARALGGRPCKSGWMMRCPAHEDHDPSCSITEVAGKVLIHCHAGCRQDDVVAALRERGLWPEPQIRSDTRRTSYAQTERERQLVAEYNYTDEAGALLYQVLRYEPGRDGKKKEFSQRYPDGRGGWIWKKGRRQALYHLPEVLEAPIVFAVEGEKDVETLRERGFVGTCNAGGAGKWLADYNQFFTGKSVIVIPDRDPAGFAHARQVVGGIRRYAASFIVIDLEDAKDISEWFDHGHSEVELVTLLEDAWARQEVALHGEGH
jgi:5S rRNA maturation endonuclease (ribonuclease M5)